MRVYNSEWKHSLSHIKRNKFPGLLKHHNLQPDSRFTQNLHIISSTPQTLRKHNFLSFKADKWYFYRAAKVFREGGEKRVLVSRITFWIKKGGPDLFICYQVATAPSTKNAGSYSPNYHRINTPIETTLSRRLKIKVECIFDHQSDMQPLNIYSFAVNIQINNTF